MYHEYNHLLIYKSLWSVAFNPWIFQTDLYIFHTTYSMHCGCHFGYFSKIPKIKTRLGDCEAT